MADVELDGFDCLRSCLVLELDLETGAGVLSLRRLTRGPSGEVIGVGAMYAIA